MSKMTTTTTMSGFRTEDITFKGARRQSEIEKEIPKEIIETTEVKVPTSVTPEQIKSFFNEKIKASYDSNEKRIYSQTISWIDELLDLRKTVVKYEEQEEIRNRLAEEAEVGYIEE